MNNYEYYDFLQRESKKEYETNEAAHIGQLVIDGKYFAVFEDDIKVVTFPDPDKAPNIAEKFVLRLMAGLILPATAAGYEQAEKIQAAMIRREFVYPNFLWSQNLRRFGKKLMWALMQSDYFSDQEFISKIMSLFSNFAQSQFPHVDFKAGFNEKKAKEQQEFFDLVKDFNSSFTKKDFNDLFKNE